MNMQNLKSIVTKTGTLAIKALIYLFLFSLVLQRSAVAQIPTNGLIFHWSMNQTSGLVAYDSSTNDNNGSLIGTNWPGDPGCTLPLNSQWITNGESGTNYALHFDAGITGAPPTPTCVEITGLQNEGIWNGTTTTNSMTWSLWVRLDSYSSFQNVMARPTGVGDGDNLGFDTTGEIPRVLWNNGGTPSATIQSAAGAIPTNVWVHLALTYDYYNHSNLTLYVNGGAVASATNAGVRAFTGTIDLGRRGNQEFAFPGDIDDAYFYNRALSPSEIATMAGVPFGPPEITLAPVNQVLWPGQVAAFNVTAIGVPPLNYQWYQSGMSLSGQTNSSLIYTNVQPSQAGAYSVVITNIYGAVTSSASLFVLQTNDVPASTPSWLCTNGLVFYWNMDNTTNFEAFDTSGNNNDGALINFPLNGSQQVPGFTGNGLYIQSLNGSLPQVVVTNLPMITNTTWAAWVKAQPNDFGTILSASFPGAADGSCLGFGSGSNNMHPRLLWNNGVGSTTIQAPEALDYNDWNFVAVTYESTNTTLTLFVNGKQDGVSQVASSTPFNYMAAGVRLSAQEEEFKGAMDDVLCYNRALSPGEIEALYLNSISNGQVPFRWVKVQTQSFTNSQIGGTNTFTLNVRTLWTNGVPVLLGTTNLADASSWQAIPGAQFNPSNTETIYATATSSVPNLFILAGVAEPAPLFYDDLQSGAPGWTHGGQNDSWTLGVPTNGPYGGPNGGYNGETNVFSTGLNGTYNGAETAWLHSPPINLGGLQQATIVFEEWADIFADPLFDYAEVNLVDANSQQYVATGLWQFAGATTNYTADGWITRVVDIPSPNTMSSTNVEVEFLIETDPYNNPLPGWFLDNVEVLPYGNPY